MSKKPTKKPAPAIGVKIESVGDDLNDVLSQKDIEKLEAAAKDPAPEWTPKQRLLLVGATLGAVVSMTGEYPRRHTLELEAAVQSRFMDKVREIRQKETEAGIKGGLSELAEADCRQTLELPL